MYFYYHSWRVLIIEVVGPCAAHRTLRAVQRRVRPECGREVVAEVRGTNTTQVHGCSY
jgi:hypothetical protein